MKTEKPSKPFKYDWNQLFMEWVESPLDKNEFLRTKGISPHGCIAKRKTERWYKSDVKKAIRRLSTIERDALTSSVASEEVSELESTIKYHSEKPNLTVRDAIKEVWQVVQGWRQRQAENDYKLADNIRMHCRAILNSNIKIVDDPTSDKKIVQSSLKTNELLNIAKITEIVQKVQRLALGLSTENIGVDHGLEIDEKENVPIFEVQINQDGKFVNVR